MLTAEVEVDLFPRLDEVAAQWSEALGETVSRSQVIRALLGLGTRNPDEGLQAFEEMRIEQAKAEAEQARLEEQRDRLELLQNRKPRPSDLERGVMLRRRRDSNP